MGLPRWHPACQCRRLRRKGFNPWVGKIPWRRKSQPTPVFLSEKSHGQRSLAGYSPWGHKESDTTEHACILHIYYLMNEWMNKWMGNFLLPLLWGSFSLVSLCPLPISVSPGSFLSAHDSHNPVPWKKRFSLVPRSSWGYWFLLIPLSFILYVHVLQRRVYTCFFSFLSDHQSWALCHLAFLFHPQPFLWELFLLRSHPSFICSINIYWVSSVCEARQLEHEKSHELFTSCNLGRHK